MQLLSCRSWGGCSAAGCKCRCGAAAPGGWCKQHQSGHAVHCLRPRTAGGRNLLEYAAFLCGSCDPGMPQEHSAMTRHYRQDPLKYTAVWHARCLDMPLTLLGAPLGPPTTNACPATCARHHQAEASVGTPEILCNTSCLCVPECLRLPASSWRALVPVCH